MSDKSKINSERNSFTNIKVKKSNSSSWKLVLDNYSKVLDKKKQNKSLSKDKDNLNKKTAFYHSK